MLKLQQYEKEEAEIDQILISLGLKRIRIPKDGSCLFRGGQLELEAASQLYKLHITVFSTGGICASHGEEYKRKMNLSYIHGNHYDIVYSDEYFKKLEFCQSIVYSIVTAVSTNDEVVDFSDEHKMKWIYFNVEYEEWKDKMHKKKKKTTNKKNKTNSNGLKSLSNGQEPVKNESIWDTENEYVTSNKKLEETENEKIVVVLTKEAEEEKKKKEEQILKAQELEMKKKEQNVEKEIPKKKNYHKRDDQYDDEFSKFVAKYKNKTIYPNIIVIGNYDRTAGFALKAMKSAGNVQKWFIFDIFGHLKLTYSIGKQVDIPDLFMIFDKALFSKYYLLDTTKERLNEIYDKLKIK